MPNRALAPSAPKELSELAPRGSKEPGFRRERPAPEDLEADIRGWGIASTVSLLIFRPGPERRQQDGTADPPAVIAVRALRIASPFRKTPYAAHAPEHPDARARRPT